MKSFTTIRQMAAAAIINAAAAQLQTARKSRTVINLFSCILCISWYILWCITGTAAAQLKIDSVYPTLGKMGESLPVTIKGGGFGADTRVSMYLDSGNKKAIIGSIETPGYAYAIMVSKNKAYVADYDGLQIIDVSNPSVPVIIGSIYTPGYAQDVTVINEIAYVADGSNGLQIIDVSDPYVPVNLGSVKTPGIARSVSINGNIAYVADDESGLQVIDITNPISPKIIGAVSSTYIHALDVAVKGNTAIVADWYSGLLMIDISNPSVPKIIGAIDTGSPQSVSVIENTVYVADAWSGLQVIDISRPTLPKKVGQIATPGRARSVTCIGNIAYVADKESGVVIVDISNSASPIIIGYVDTPGEAYSVTTIGDLLYVADYNKGIQLIDKTRTETKQLFNNIPISGYIDEIAFDGRIVYAAGSYDYDITIIDLSDSQHPNIIGGIDLRKSPGATNPPMPWAPVLAMDITLSSNRAYVASGGGGLQELDISNPKYPIVTRAVDTPAMGIASEVAVSNNIACVLIHGIRCLQVVDLSKFTIIGAVDLPCAGFNIALNGYFAYFFCGQNLLTVDISNPESPKIIHSMEMDNCRDIAVKDKFLYVADDDNLKTIDMSNPKEPIIINTLKTWKRAENIIISGDMAFVALGNDGFFSVDISIPSNPTIIGYVDTPGYAADIIVSENRAVIADGYNGIIVSPTPLEIKPVTNNNTNMLSVSMPSPQIPGHYTIRVFNNSGDFYELPGAVTFQEGDFYGIQRQKKAILISGSGNYPANALWKATQTCTNLAYLSLLAQGYTRENVFFLSTETGTDIDGDGLSNDIDRTATLDNLSYAVKEWAKDAEELLIYMTGHGGSGTFMLNGTTTPVQILEASVLDGWIDTLQTAMHGKVIFIYDACQSGSFLSTLTGINRILIASAKPDERAWFMQNGVLSFSYQFWVSVFLNANLYKSYIAGKDMMKSDQTTLLDADANAVPNEKTDYSLTHDVIIGRGRVAASIPPTLYKISDPVTLNGETTATIRAGETVALNPITRIWAVITPPDASSASTDQPILTLPTVDLQGPDAAKMYSGTWDGFYQQGVYKITVFAQDSEGQYSLPLLTTVTQTLGVSDERGNINGIDGTNLADAVIALKVLAGMNTTGMIRSDYAASGADISGDTRVGLAEAVYALRKAAGM